MSICPLILCVTTRLTFMKHSFDHGLGPHVTSLPLLWPIRNTSSVQFSHSVGSDSLRLHEPQHARPACPSPTPGVYQNSCPLNWWCHPTNSSSVNLFSSCLQSFPASRSFPVSQLFASGGQSIGVSASTSVLQRIGWISLQSKGLSRIFSNTTVQKH